MSVEFVRDEPVQQIDGIMKDVGKGSTGPTGSYVQSEAKDAFALCD